MTGLFGLNIEGIMRVFFVIIVFSFCYQLSFGQDQARMVNTIQEEYTDLIKTLAEINVELQSTSNKEIKSELRFAKKELINDFFEGPYRIFDSRCTSAIGGVNLSTKKLLSTLTHSNINKVIISVTEVTSEKKQLTVHFTQKGVASSEQDLTASFITVGDKLLIKNLNDAYTSPEPIIDLTTNKRSANTDQRPMPIIDVRVLSTPSGQIQLYGTIIHARDQGQLLLSVSDQVPYEIYLNETNSYSTSLPYQSDKSFDITLTYQYGDKFIMLHKNIVTIKDKQTITKNVIQDFETDSPAETGGHE